MAFNLGGGGGEDDDRVMADINVTPLVDVMLVLLIIFMVAAPMLHQGIEVALPRADARNLPLRVEDPLVVSINRDGLVFLRDAPVDPDQLVERLTAQLQGREQDTVFLKGDRDAPYGKIVDVLDILQQGGIKNVGMVTEKRRQGGS
ncbi:MAG TPA: protein TolR [Thermoanaerobaculia bacterium]|nr:protein TolR [Thermoanaerobaculia bacterium]